jgi:hypothetical protein cdivTM_02983
VTKYFTLIKHHPCAQLAHLYEHLFITTVTDYFYRHKQYKLLDYALNGSTYDSGVIVISAECYSKKSAELFKNLAMIKTSFGEHPVYLPVSQALSQIVAEGPEKLFVSDTDMIIDELKKLDGQSWQDLDSIDLLPKDIHKNNSLRDLIYFTDQPTVRPNKIELQLQFSNKSIELRMLWRELTRFLSLSIGQNICQNFGAYFADEHAKDNENLTTVSNTFLVSPHILPKVNIEEITNNIRHTLKTITEPEILNRFANYLSLTSYKSNPNTAPNEDRLLREFGAVMGSTGWKRVATVENLIKVLQATQISLHHNGSKRESGRIYK